MNTEAILAVIPGRRAFLRTVGCVAGIALTGCVATRKKAGELNNAEQEAEVTPGEDLMQEHGVLERILLIYDEAARRIESSEHLDPAVIVSAAGIIRRFVEDYHEKLEEHVVFPRFQTARCQRGTQRRQVALPIHGLRRVVKNGPVMSHLELRGRYKGRDVRLAPGHPTCRRPSPSAGIPEGGCRHVDRGHIPKSTGKQAVHDARRTAVDVNDRGRPPDTGPSNQIA